MHIGKVSKLESDDSMLVVFIRVLNLKEKSGLDDSMALALTRSALCLIVLC